VTDNEPPHVVGSCPSNFTVPTNVSQPFSTVQWAAVAFADNDAVSTLTSTADSGDAFPIGITSVTYTATDKSGNVKQCGFSITVVDSEAPKISGLPTAPLTMYTVARTKYAVLSRVEPTVTDNSGLPVANQWNFADGTELEIGTVDDWVDRPDMEAS